MTAIAQALPLEFCHECGRLVGVIWTATDEMWARVTGKDEGVLCIQCFDNKAAVARILLRWTPTVIKRGEGE